MAQNIEVIYTNDIVKCSLCNKEEQSNGKICIMKDCNHHYHIKCIINYVVINNKKNCPICQKKFDDIRISIAVAFQKNSLTELVGVTS